MKNDIKPYLIKNTNSLRFLRLPQVKNKVGLSRSSIYLKMKKNEFPQSIKLSVRCVAWVESEIEECMNKIIQPRQKIT